MPYKERKELIKKVEKLRGGRALIAFLNFDRRSVPDIAGLAMGFDSDVKEPLYRILKETASTSKGVDLFLYTRGGDTNSVWPIVSLLREYDPEFHVIVPFRAHSAGTMVALAAKRIVMTRISELSPIDPSTGNQFNPIDQIQPANRLGISVEDVNAYKDFIKEALAIEKGTGNPHRGKLTTSEREALQPYIQRLTTEIHPIALGNVHRVHKLIQHLAKKLLLCNPVNGQDNSEIVSRLTVQSYSHLHTERVNENETLPSLI